MPGQSNQSGLDMAREHRNLSRVDESPSQMPCVYKKLLHHSAMTTLGAAMKAVSIRT